MACAGPSGSATVVIGDGFAEACSKAALGDRSDAQSIQQCDAALESEALDAHDRAGTLVNRGVMRLRREEFELARADFDAAIVLAPKAGEAYGNRGAVFVGEKRFQAGLDDINNALRLGVKEPEKAYFNRALAYEGLDDEKIGLPRFPTGADAEARLGTPGARAHALCRVTPSKPGLTRTHNGVGSRSFSGVSRLRD